MSPWRPASLGRKRPRRACAANHTAPQQYRSCRGLWQGVVCRKIALGVDARFLGIVRRHPADGRAIKVAPPRRVGGDTKKEAAMSPRRPSSLGRKRPRRACAANHAAPQQYLLCDRLLQEVSSSGTPCGRKNSSRRVEPERGLGSRLDDFMKQIQLFTENCRTAARPSVRGSGMADMQIRHDSVDILAYDRR